MGSSTSGRNTTFGCPGPHPSAQSASSIKGTEHRHYRVFALLLAGCALSWISTWALWCSFLHHGHALTWQIIFYFPLYLYYQGSCKHLDVLSEFLPPNKTVYIFQLICWLVHNLKWSFPDVSGCYGLHNAVITDGNGDQMCSNTLHTYSTVCCE